MSKERELLNKAIEMIQIVPLMASIGHAAPDFGSELLLEIQELLTQPEQEPSSDDFMYNKLKESYDELVESSLKDFQRGYGAALAHAIYVKEPTREPLSDEAVCQILLKKEWKGFVELVRIIEKAHGIGGGE